MSFSQTLAFAPELQGGATVAAVLVRDGTSAYARTTPRRSLTMFRRKRCIASVRRGCRRALRPTRPARRAVRLRLYLLLLCPVSLCRKYYCAAGRLRDRGWPHEYRGAWPFPCARGR